MATEERRLILFEVRRLLKLIAFDGFMFFFSPSVVKFQDFVRTKACGFASNAVRDVPVAGMVDVPLAQTGEGIAECELLKWFVQEVSL